MQSNVVLINTFFVPHGLEHEFPNKWQETARQMRRQPGFIDTNLHRSLGARPRFRFINIAHWQSKEQWRAAIAKLKIAE